MRYCVNNVSRSLPTTCVRAADTLFLVLSVNDTSQIDLVVIPYWSKWLPCPSLWDEEPIPIGICFVENTSRWFVDSCAFIHRPSSVTRIDFAATLPHVKCYQLLNYDSSLLT